MKIIIVGAGAVGGFIGGLLQQAGNDVTFLARGRHLEKMKENGLTVNHEDETIKVSGNFSDDFSTVAGADLLIITVKSTETVEVCQQIKRYLTKNTYLLSLQNGVINEEILSEMFGREWILSGVAYVTARVEEPGKVEQSGKHMFIIGNLTSVQKEMTDQVIRLFQEAGIQSKYSSEITKKKWEKSLWNVTFNPLSVVSSASVGEILDDQKLRRTAELVLKEIVEVAKHHKIEITKEMESRVFKNAESAKHHTTSMLQDYKNKKPMEIEALCGYFVKSGEKIGLNVPVLKTIYSILLFIDHSNRSQPDSYLN